METFYIIITLIFIIFIFIILNRTKERYYLRDIPYNLGFGGWPSEIYSPDINKKDYQGYHIGMYGSIIGDGSKGYDPGAGLVW